MPKWEVHIKWATRLGIDKEIADTVNREIDSIGDPEYHDYGRVIVEGHWLFNELCPELLKYYKSFQDDGVKAFLLHHILDYMNTLLYSPSVNLESALNHGRKLLKNIKEDSKRRIESKKLRELVINCCKEIAELIGNKELLFDIKPELSEWYKWAEKRIIKLTCEKCGKTFITIDEEARIFLAGNGIGIPERHLKYCLECSELKPLSTWIEEERDEVIKHGSATLVGSKFHRYHYSYSKSMPVKVADQIWAEKWGKTDALIHVLRAAELEELEH